MTHDNNLNNLSSTGVPNATYIELQWLKNIWNHENMFETGVVQVNEG